MKRHSLILALLILGTAGAEAYDGENDFSHNRTGLSGSLTSSDCWRLELSYHYMFSRYIGAGGGAGFLKNYFTDGYASGRNWHIDSEYIKPDYFYLRPSIVLKSSSIRIRQTRWGLYAEPGAFITIPYTSVYVETTYNWPACDYHRVSTKKGQWFAADIRLGLYVDIGPMSVSFGYSWTNYDIYSQYRRLSYQGISFSEFYPKKPVMHGAFLTLSGQI